MTVTISLFNVEDDKVAEMVYDNATDARPAEDVAREFARQQTDGSAAKALIRYGDTGEREIDLD